MKQTTTIKLLYFIGLSVWVFAIGYYLGSDKPATIIKNNVCSIKFVSDTPKITTVGALPKVTPQSWRGKVSYYSRAGCLGCSPTLTMANGEPLDDTRLTIAFNRVKLNSMVKITNLDNNKSVIAKVTDTGGFESLGRIADLGVAVKDEIEAKTDTSDILIELLKN